MADDQLNDENTKALCFNGINGATGDSLLPPLSPREVAKLAAGEPLDPEEFEQLKIKWIRASQPAFAPVFGVDTNNLAQAGWGVIFAPDVTEEEKEALAPLLKLRQAEAGDLYTDFPAERAYRPGDSKDAFLKRSKVGPGPAVPKKVPYYLLIVGSPEAIPYRFQYQLDVQYAVGRIHFDTPDAYARYAQSVVAAEREEVQRPRDVTFFGVRNRADQATQLSADYLITPLKETLAQEEPSWNWRCLVAEEAKKETLQKLLGGEETPALLVSASHGMGFPKGDPRQLSHQGAMLCQDWPGPLKHQGPIPEDFYLAGDHIAADAKLQGLIAFFFACYGGGTPREDDFAHLGLAQPDMTPPHAFVAALPKRLLGHPQGGALAIVGHVERAWTYSFLWERTGAQLAAFESAIRALLNGQRVGAAMEYFNVRYSELSTMLNDELTDRKARPPRPESETLAEDEAFSGIWTANNDARSYVVLGDPAVRLAVESKDAAENH